MTKENQMRDLYDKFLKTSGKTKKDFCLENNVGFHKYKYWEHKFASQSKPQKGFISIVSKPLIVPTMPNHLVLEYPNGVKISAEASNFSLIRQLIGLI
jgi:hypothetical protein